MASGNGSLLYRHSDVSKPLQSQNFPLHFLNKQPKFLSVSWIKLFSFSETTSKIEELLGRSKHLCSFVKASRSEDLSHTGATNRWVRNSFLPVYSPPKLPTVWVGHQDCVINHKVCDAEPGNPKVLRFLVRQ